MTIKRYEKQDEAALFALIENEGEAWADYHSRHKAQYKRALQSSVTYVAYEGDALCGYCRCRDDDGFGLYVYDLLVDRACRGKQIGRALMSRVCADSPGEAVYVMSDVDGYYEKLGYEREGSVFSVRA